MERLIKVFNEIFETSLSEGELDRDIETVVDWDSFIIMNFMSEMADRYNADIDIALISSVETVDDVLELIKGFEK